MKLTSTRSPGTHASTRATAVAAGLVLLLALTLGALRDPAPASSADVHHPDCAGIGVVG